MIAPLLAYDAAGNIVGQLEYLVAHNEHGDVVGLVDFEAHERAGGKMRDIWDVSDAVGSGAWPEWLGSAVYGFTVELDADKRIVALVHRASGYRRERSAIEAAIAKAPVDEHGRKDLRRIVGGPNRPLVLDEQGRTVVSTKPAGTLAHLPLVGRPPVSSTP